MMIYGKSLDVINATRASWPDIDVPLLLFAVFFRNELDNVTEPLTKSSPNTATFFSSRVVFMADLPPVYICYQFSEYLDKERMDHSINMNHRGKL